MRHLKHILSIFLLVSVQAGNLIIAQTGLGELLTKTSNAPNDPKSIEALGTWYYNQGMYVPAKELFDKAIKTGGKSDTLHLKIAKCQMQMGDTTAALGKAQSVIADFPESGEAHLALAEFQHKTGAYADALESVKKANTLVRGQLKPYGYNLQGILELRQKNPEEAAELFGKAIELNPRFLPSYRNLFRLQMTLGDHSDALQTAKSGLEISPGKIEFINAALSAYLAMGKSNAAIKFIEKQEATYPKEQHIKAYKAQAYLANGDTTAGCKVFNKLLTAKEMDPMLTLYLDQVPCVNKYRLKAHQLRAGAKAHFEIKEYGLSLQYLNELLKISQNNPDDYYMRAMIRLAAGKSQKAQEDLDMALELDSKHTDAIILQAVLLFEQQDYAGFKQMLDFAEKNCPNARVYFNLGLYYRETKDFTSAEKYMLKALEEGYKDTNSLYTELSKLYFAQKNKEEGCKCLKMAILLGNSSAELDYVLECE